MMRPFLITLRVITISLLLALCTGITVYAEISLKDAVLDDGILDITGSVDSLGKDQNLTLLVTPLKNGSYDMDNIIFIGQQPISNNLFTISFPLTLDNGFYVARVGGSGIEDPRFIIINRKGAEYKLLWGDVDLNGSIDASDALLTLQYVLTPNDLSLSELQLYAANVENDKTITASSAAWILSKTLNEKIVFPAEYK